MNIVSRVDAEAAVVEAEFDPKDVEPTKGDDANRKVMSPRMVVCAIGPDGFPPLPAMIGDVVVWDVMLDWGDGMHREYRIEGTDRLVLIRRMANVYLEDGTPAALALVSIPAATYDGTNKAFEVFVEVLKSVGLVHGVWAPTKQKDGSYSFSSLDEDESPVAAVARASIEERTKRFERSAQLEEMQDEEIPK